MNEDPEQVELTSSTSSSALKVEESSGGHGDSELESDKFSSAMRC